MLLLAACAQTIAQCERNGDVRLSSSGQVADLPEGCQVREITGSGFAKLECRDGREGFAFALEQR
jgi:hypothetical protein